MAYWSACLLPAINGAREAARRVQCANNLTQLSLALHHYLADHKVLPPGVVNDTAPIATAPAGYHYSWIVQILPDLDHRELFRMINFRNGAYDPSNRDLAHDLPGHSDTALTTPRAACPVSGRRPDELCGMPS